MKHFISYSEPQPNSVKKNSLKEKKLQDVTISDCLLEITTYKKVNALLPNCYL
jgi:hypothetical protein